MAGQAAKKAAAARSQAAGTYLPIIAVANLVWLALRFGLYGSHSLHWPEGLALLSLGGVQYYAYTNILDQIANGSSKDKKKLAGGVFLDVLALALILQYAAVLLWRPLYWAVLLFPAWGAYGVYSTFAGGTGMSQQQQSQPAADDPQQYMNRKQKRAEKKEKMKR